MATEPEHALLRAALPNYDIGPELGRGGWGVVYAASHAKLGRRVAIKSLPRSFASDSAVRGRFLEEAQFAARLSHPHVVQVHDYVDAHGVLALVMERMEPRTLWDRFVDDGVLADMACALTVAVSSALHAAHLLGRAHLDVKPENVLFDATNVPKLSDFGVARIIGIGREQRPLTEVIGTPAYMSPEQARGLQVGPASDVYSTAVMAYELLAGRLPFPATDSPQDMLGHHVNTPAMPLSGVPAPLADAIMQGLAKDPAARYPSAEAFGLAIGRAATEAYGGRWLRDSGVELRLPGRLLDGIQLSARETPSSQQPSRATPGPATQPHARLGTVLEPARSAMTEPPTAAAGAPRDASDPDQQPMRTTGAPDAPVAPGAPPQSSGQQTRPESRDNPTSPGGTMSGPQPPQGPPTDPSGPSVPQVPRLPPPPTGAGFGPAALPFNPGSAAQGSFHPTPERKSAAPKVLAGIAAVLLLIAGVVVATKVFGGGGESAATTTTSAVSTSTSAGPSVDREGTVIDKPLLDAFAAACMTLKLDGDKSAFCGCARDAVPALSTKKEIEAATAAFLGIAGSIPPPIQAAMKTCTTSAAAPPASATSTSGP